MQRFLSRFVPAVGLAAFLAAPALAGESEPRRPNFTGHWKLDAAKSDDARAKMREAMAGDGPGSEGGEGGGERGHGGFGGDMGGGGMGGHRGGDGKGEGGRGEDVRTAFEGMELIAITQSDATLDTLYANGRQRKLKLDGKDQLRGEGEHQTWTKAHWQGAKLVIEAKSGEGRSHSETWEMGPDGKMLTLTTRLQGGKLRQPVVIFRVYETAPEAPSPYHAPDAEGAKQVP